MYCFHAAFQLFQIYLILLLSIIIWLGFKCYVAEDRSDGTILGYSATNSVKRIKTRFHSLTFGLLVTFADSSCVTFC